LPQISPQEVVADFPRSQDLAGASCSPGNEAQIMAVLALRAPHADALHKIVADGPCLSSCQRIVEDLRENLSL
jgi:hypothetical protein